MSSIRRGWLVAISVAMTAGAARAEGPSVEEWAKRASTPENTSAAELLELSKALAVENAELRRLIQEETNRVTYLRDAVMAPIGSVVAYAGDVGAGLPAGWRRCDGSPLKRSEYPELFAIIGTRYGGSGDEFLLPNLVGAYVSGAQDGALAQRAGAAEHAHSVSLAGQTSSARNGHWDSGPQTRNTGGGWSPTGADHWHKVALSGASENASSLPPTLQLHFLIRVKPNVPARRP